MLLFFTKLHMLQFLVGLFDRDVFIVLTCERLSALQRWCFKRSQLYTYYILFVVETVVEDRDHLWWNFATFNFQFLLHIIFFKLRHMPMQITFSKKEAFKGYLCSLRSPIPYMQYCFISMIISISFLKWVLGF